MNRRIARSLLMLTIVVLALTASACGSDDPYSGSWSNFRYGPVIIEPANAGWWSITPGQGAKTSYGVDMDGMLQTGNGAMTFTPSGDKLIAVFAPGMPTVELTKE